MEITTLEEQQQFYRSSIWKAWRLDYIARHPFERECEMCSIPVEGSQIILDHLVGIRAGGEQMSDDNIQVLCRPCNGRKRSSIIVRKNFVDDEVIRL